MKVRLRLLDALILSLTVITHMSLSIVDVQETEKFLVIRASPSTKQQLDVVRELHDNMHKYDLDFWLTPVSPGHKADIMVRQHQLNWLQSVLGSHGISHNITIRDVQRLILDREHKPRRASTNFSRRLHDEGGNRAKYGLGEYHSYDHIVSWLEEIQRFYPDKARVISIGTTEEGRTIQGIKIGNEVRRTDKRVVWIDGGIHAREWAAVHTAIYIIDRLIADYETDPLVRKAVDQLNFYVFPVLNPDGYEYSRSEITPVVRLWRKNRSSMVCKKDYWYRERCCGGVDLNRNFDWFWGEIGSSPDRCSEIYHGRSVFSEAESRAVRDAMLSSELHGKVDAFLTLHTYSQLWIHPFSHQPKTVPEDIADIEQVGRRAVSALESVYGTKYRFGTGADILYASSGGSDDWAKGKLGCKYVYLMELRPGEEVWDGFILDPRQLIPTGRETWAGIKVVIEAVLNLKREIPSSSSAVEKIETSLSSLPSTALALEMVISPSMMSISSMSTTSSLIPTSSIASTSSTVSTPSMTTVSTMTTEPNTADSAEVTSGSMLIAPLTHMTTSIPLSNLIIITAASNPLFAITVSPLRFVNLVRATTHLVHLMQDSDPQWIAIELQHTAARTFDRTTTLDSAIPLPKAFTFEPSIRPATVQPSQPKLHFSPSFGGQNSIVQRQRQKQARVGKRQSRRNLRKRKRIINDASQLHTVVMKQAEILLRRSKEISIPSTSHRVTAVPFDSPPMANVRSESKPKLGGVLIIDTSRLRGAATAHHGVVHG